MTAMHNNPEMHKRIITSACNKPVSFNFLKTTQDKVHQSEAGKRSRIHENSVAAKIASQYDHFYLPNEVCDRIGIRNGRIYFIEIKQKWSKLRPKQAEFQSAVGSSYIIVRE